MGYTKRKALTNLLIYYYLQLNGTGPKNLVNKQYNTPLNIYSEQTIKETLDKHSEVLETGVVG